MPYKHPNITYGLPTDPMDNKLISEYIEDLIAALGLIREPIGVKLIFDEEQYKNINTKEIPGKMSYCCMVEKASRGMSFKSKVENHNCDGGTTALGLEPSTESIESGATYFSYNLYKTPAAARRTREALPGLYRTGTRTHGIYTSPLNKITVVPDVVILVVNPYQAMRVQQGYVYEIGGRMEFHGAAMQAVCADATVEPYLTGKMNITTFCPSTRLLARWRDDEMAIGMPFEHFTRMVEGVMATINSTDIVKRKEEIIQRFKEKGKELKLDMISYE